MERVEPMEGRMMTTAWRERVWGRSVKNVREGQRGTCVHEAGAGEGGDEADLVGDGEGEDGVVGVDGR